MTDDELYRLWKSGAIDYDELEARLKQNEKIDCRSTFVAACVMGMSILALAAALLERCR